MSNSLEALPFYFRSVHEAKKIILTNQAGSFLFLDDHKDLENVIHAKLDDLNPELTDELVAKSFLTPKSEKNIRCRSITSRMASSIAKAINPPSLFMIIPTLRCDHDCRYCQVSRAPLSRKGVDLETHHIDNIINMIDEINVDDIKIEFQGGEPLLAFDFIKEFHKKAIARFNERNISFVICSALGPMNETMIDWFSDNNIQFSVSLDGPELLHQQNRPSRYFNSYTNTVDNIKSLQDSIGHENVSCLSTISKLSLSVPDEIVDSYYDLGLPSIFLRPLSPFGFAANSLEKIGYSVDDYMEFYSKALANIIDKNKESVFIEENALLHLRKIFQPEKANYIDLQSPSGYVFGALVFNYDGNVFGSDEARMLWESTKVNELVLGHVENDIEEVISNQYGQKILSNSFISCTPGCEECAYNPFCGSDPLHHLATQGDYIGDKSVSYFCEYQTKMFDHLFSLWETNEAAQGVFRSWLNR